MITVPVKDCKLTINGREVKPWPEPVDISSLPLWEGGKIDYEVAEPGNLLIHGTQVRIDYMALRAESLIRRGLPLNIGDDELILGAYVDGALYYRREKKQ